MSNFLNNDTVFILDSYGLIYREYFAFISRPLTNSKKENISAVFGFFRNISSILKMFNPKYMLAAMDSKTPTFRHEMYAEYKATRQKTPDDLKAQFPWIEDLLATLGIPVVRCDGFEADDVIATVAKKAASENHNVCILSADKDLMQLTSEKIHIMKPDRDAIWKEMDEAAVSAEWGVPPEKLLDLLSLMGDTADNVPGVKGVGQKTAVKLLSQYDTLEGIYEHAAEIKGALGEKIRNDKDNAFFSKKLITLNSEVPCITDIDAFKTEELHTTELAKKLVEFELPAVAKNFANLASKNTESKSEPQTQSQTENQSEEIDLTPAKPNEGDYKAITNAEELSKYVDEAIKAKLVAFDTETDSLNTREANLIGFSLSFEPGKGAYIPVIVTDPLLNGPTVPKNDALKQLARLFESDAKIIMHNAKFDLQVLASNGLKLNKKQGEQKSANLQPSLFDDLDEDFNSDEIKIPSSKNLNIADTMIAAWLTEPDRTGKSAYSLEYLAETKLHLKGTEFAEIVPKNGTFADVPIQIASNYGAEDADFTLQLWNYFEPVLKEQNLYEIFNNMEMKVLPILAQMELNGIHISPDCLKTYAVELSGKIKSIEKDIYETVGHEFNIASPKQLADVLFNERGLKGTKKTKTGYSTNEEVLETLAAYDPVPKMILDYRSNAKLLSTYVETLPEMIDENSRIHTTFMQTGTATGRLSSKDPNLQNIPVRDEAGRKIRSAFTAAPGTVLISADYAQIELVVLAHLSGDKNLCDAFNSGTDVHKSTASLIYGVPMEQVTAEMRRNAKTLNFGLMYGMSAFRLANEIGTTRTQAKEFIDNYFAIYSGVQNFFEENIRKAEETGFITTIKGRKRAISGINSANKLIKEAAIRIAKNSPIQGSAADIVKQAMIDVSDALEKSSLSARLLLQVHDELILECKDEPGEIEKTIALVKDKMENAVKLNVPLRVSIEHGKNWGEFH
ncbi:DNA polymerase I [Treponema zioleckii]|uniref:DNA polymerase I n=1 Tax=Treponema zioleckii TaxID=331680 RepID=UPI00168A4173|nr:DNA polymerase I [Treponema zioleckii]